MPRPRFSEMLVTRRRQLGLSISQASQVLRLKEQVLIAFEEGDFDHIPKSGYAQGMLSSYARYLGLNPRQVVNQFSADLNDYMKSGGPATSGDSYGSGNPYVASRGLLPTSGGPAGDLGAFATTSQPHSRQQSTPLVNQRRYVGTLHDEPQRTYGYDTEDDYYAQTTEQRPYTVRQPLSAQQRTRSTGGRSRSRRSSERSGSSRYGSYVRDEVTTRRVTPSQYVDDLRYDDETSPYDAASSHSGRASSHNIASTSRPNVQRRQSDARRSREAPRRRGGVLGSLIEFFSDGTHALVAIIGILAVVLTAIIIVSVRSCVNNQATDTGRVVPVTQSATKTDDETAEAVDNAVDSAADNLKDEEGKAEGTDGSKTTTKTDSKPKETKVTVSVEAGAVSWVEVLCDGESKVATTVTGPWSETYDVHESITISANDTTVVKVTENGVQRQFDAKASGIGTITIQGTPEQKTETTDNSADTTETEDKNTETEGENKEKSKTEGTGEDEYLYTYNGYDIYYNEAGDYYYFIDEETGARINAVDGTPI